MLQPKILKSLSARSTQLPRELSEQVVKIMKGDSGNSWIRELPLLTKENFLCWKDQEHWIKATREIPDRKLAIGLIQSIPINERIEVAQMARDNWTEWDSQKCLFAIKAELGITDTWVLKQVRLAQPLTFESFSKYCLFIKMSYEEVRMWNRPSPRQIEDMLAKFHDEDRAAFEDQFLLHGMEEDLE